MDGREVSQRGTTSQREELLHRHTLSSGLHHLSYRYNDSLSSREFRHAHYSSEAMFPHSWHALFTHSASPASDAQYILLLISRGLNARPNDLGEMRERGETRRGPATGGGRV